MGPAPSRASGLGRRASEPDENSRASKTVDDVKTVRRMGPPGGARLDRTNGGVFPTLTVCDERYSTRRGTRCTGCASPFDVCVSDAISA